MSLRPTIIARTDIVLEARRWIGTPYLHQGSLLHVGCDCLGLVRGVWRALLGPEPEKSGAYSPDWAEAGRIDRLYEAGRRHFHEVDAGGFDAGDVLLFRWRSNVAAKHLGIATSRKTMIHAHEGACVCEIEIGPLWRRKLAAAFAFPGVNAMTRHR